MTPRVGAYAFDVAVADKLAEPDDDRRHSRPRRDRPPDHCRATSRCGATRCYNTYCAICHGHTGAGNGPVSARLVGVPSLLTDRARGYTDGYLYSIIRYGRGLMPKYGDKVPSTGAIAGRS